MPVFFWLGLALVIVVAVIIVFVARYGSPPVRPERHQQVAGLVTYNGLPPGVTRDASGWYSCPRCGGRPCARCARRSWGIIYRRPIPGFRPRSYRSVR